MDVVAASLKSIGGELRIESKKGEGTTMYMRFKE